MKTSILSTLVILMAAVVAGCGNADRAGSPTGERTPEVKAGNADEAPKPSAKTMKQAQAPEVRAPQAAPEASPKTAGTWRQPTGVPGAQPVLTPYPGSKRFCGEHVTGAPAEDGTPGPHILWDAYYSTDPLEEVAAHYKARLGADNYRPDEDGHRWQFPIDAPERILEVWPVAAKGPWSYHDPPPPEARCIIMMISIAD